MLAEDAYKAAKTAVPGLAEAVQLESKTSGSIAKWAQDWYTTHPDEWTPLRAGEQLTDRLRDTVVQRAGDPQLQQILAHAGISPAETAKLLRTSASEAGRLLQSLQALQLGLRSRKGGKLTQFEGDLLDEIGHITNDAYTPTFGSTWQQVENLRRTLLTMHTGTSFANFFSNAGRVGLDVIENYISAVTAKAMGKDPILPATQGIEVALRLARHGDTAKSVEDVMALFPGQNQRLFNMHLEGKLNTSGLGGRFAQGLQTAQTAVDYVNVLNRFQEYAFRRAVFAARLDARLQKRGKTFDDIVDNQRFYDITIDDVKFAVDEALDMTFAKQPEFATAGYHFVNFVNKSGLTVFMPFPRFFTNALQYTFEHSPMGILKLASKAERAKIAAGDTRLIGKLATGHAMLGAAYMMIDQGAVIEDGRRLKLPDGKTVDLQRYNPYAAYFVLADIAHRKQNNRLHDIDITKLAKALGPDWRAGTGLAALDGAIEAIMGTAQADKGRATSGAKSVSGEYVGGFLTPMAIVVDFLDGFKTFTGHYAKEYDTRNSGAAPIYRNIPGLRETLPPRVVPGRGEVNREAPWARLFSFTVGPEQTPFESFMSKRGVSMNNIFPGSGLPEWDRAIAQAATPLIRYKLNAVALNPAFQRLTPALQAVEMNQLLGESRSQATDYVKRTNPKLHAQMARMQLSPEEFQAVQEMFRIPPAGITPAHIETFRRMRLFR